VERLNSYDDCRNFDLHHHQDFIRRRMKISIDVQKLIDLISRGINNSIRARVTAKMTGDDLLYHQMQGEVDAYSRVLTILHQSLTEERVK
jgi:hypothetical protein